MHRQKGTPNIPQRTKDEIEAALKAQLEAERTAALEKAAQEKAKKSRKK